MKVDSSATLMTRVSAPQPPPVPCPDRAADPPTGSIRRPAWVEVDLEALARNFRILRAELPRSVHLLYVVKDDAYGLGAVPASEVALANGAERLAVVTLEEAAELRGGGIDAPILLMGERLPEELPAALRLGLELAVGSVDTAIALDTLAARSGQRASIHLKINTGMNRFGFPWRESHVWAPQIAQLRHLEIVAAYSHFAQSDEADKSFAHLQWSRFQSVIDSLRKAGISPRLCHHANSGGTLDLPETHSDMVRVGLLAHGVYPSAVCRRLQGLRPVMTVKSRVVALQRLDPGDCVGYGMRWNARRPSRIGVIPVGYGDGYPRLRNVGHVLVRGVPAPIVGGVTMDALMIDVTDCTAEVGDEVVLMGQQGNACVPAEELAAWKGTVVYEILPGWRHRLPRRYLRG